MKFSFSLLVIIVLIAVILLQRLGCVRVTGIPPKSDTTVVVDTVWKQHDTTIYKKMTVQQVIHDTMPPEYLPSPMYDSLVVQYGEMAAEYLAIKIYSDTITVPECKGNIIIKDTVQYNQLSGRSYMSTISVPKITETVTINNYAPSKRTLYIGGGLSANKTAFQLLDAGLLFKTKQNQVYGISVGVGQDLKPVYGVRMYWKLF